MSEQIKKMLGGDVSEILNGIVSDIPILVMNAIIGGAENRVKDRRFIDSLKEQKSNDIELLHIRIGDVAIAALDVLGIEKYTGDDQAVKDIIYTQFKKAV